MSSSHRILLALLACLAGTLEIFSASPTPSPAPRNAAELRNLRAQHATRNIPVVLRGVVTCYDSASARLYVQDSTDAFAVGLSWNVAPGALDTASEIRPGDKVEIRGVTCSGMAAPFIAGNRDYPVDIRRLDQGTLPDAMDLGRWRKPTLQLHGVRAAVSGYVQSVDQSGTSPVLKVLRGGDTLEVVLQGRSEPAVSGTNLPGSDVLFTGVLALTADRESGMMRPRLIVPESEPVEVIDPGLNDAFARPSENIQTARRFASEDGTRLCFRGNVLGGVPGRILYLRVQKAGLRVRSPLIPDAELGSAVDVVGFPLIRDGELFIEDAVVRPRDSEEPVLPVALRFGEMPAPKHDADLVRISARLRNQLTRAADTVLLLESGSTTFYARSLAETAAKSWPALEPGSLLELTGIADLSPASTNGGTLTLLLRDTGDIRLVQPPPFWTPKRLLIPALAIAFVIAATLAWIVLLRRKLRAQTALIIQKVERERIAEERDRIAHELHDSLEQHLAGMAIQVDLASSRLRTSVERAGQSLDVVRALVRRSHEETRHAVWQLRSGAVTRGDLPAALAEALEWYSPDLPVNIETTGTQRALPPTATHHLLRISQEAVANALKHGRPSRIEIRLHYGESALGLQIRDDGAGFDPASVPEFIPGHFGLAGMRERIQKLGGEFRIDSRPGAGTTIVVSVPWSRLPMSDIQPAASNA